MMSQEQNDLITRIGPKTPAGKLMRHVLAAGRAGRRIAMAMRPIKPVQAARREFRAVPRRRRRATALLDRDCPHRGADLAFGRLEDGGLRCAFHGWLFDVDGNCLETPGRADDLEAVRRASASAPTRSCEKGGILLAYLGKASRRPFRSSTASPRPAPILSPSRACSNATGCRRWRSASIPAHASFLHRFFEDEDTSDRLRQAISRRLRRHRPADDQDPARIRSADHQRRGHRIRPAPDRAARTR